MRARIVNRSRSFGLGLYLAALGLGCNPSVVFQCSEDGECGAGGTCEEVGYCSFPDERCPSEQRYGEYAGDGLSGTCVGDGGSSSSSSSPSSSSSSGDPTVDPDDGADSTTGLGDGCEGGDVCMPLAPPGWEGPLLAMLGTGTAPACPPSVPEELLVGNAGLSAPSAGCACECDGVDCDLEAFASLAGDCAMEVPIPFETDTCLPIDLSVAPLETTILVPAVGGCTTSEFVELSPPQWTDEVRLCQGMLESCGDGVCVPDSVVGAGGCIYQEGEHTCPLSVYTQPFTFYRSFSDARGCSSCSCQGGNTCVVSAFEDSMCSSPDFFSASLDSELCVTVGDVLPEGIMGEIGMIVESVGDDGCEASGAEPEGIVTPEEPFTVCCRP